MSTTGINIKAIKAVAASLKQNFPRKRGIIMRISGSVETLAYGRQHVGFAIWEGNRESLRSALDTLFADWPAAVHRQVVRLHATHPAVRDVDCPESRDITGLVFGQRQAVGRSLGNEGGTP